MRREVKRGVRPTIPTESFGLPDEIDPEAREVLRHIADWKQPRLRDDLPGYRACAVRERELGGDLSEVPATEHVVLPHANLRVRVYHHARSELQPALVWLHGGGWVSGDVRSCEPACRLLARRSGCAVVAVDCRLAPEHPFPASLDDCVSAVRYFAAHGRSHGLDPPRLAIGGDSAGANLAAATTLVCRDAGQTIIQFQILAEPARTPAAETDSRSLYGDSAALGVVDMDGMWNLYLGSAGPTPTAAPLPARDLSGLPSAFVQIAGCDILRDEGVLYADRLAQAGVPVTREVICGLPHGMYTYFGFVGRARRALERAAMALRTAIIDSVDTTGMHRASSVARTA